MKIVVPMTSTQRKNLWRIPVVFNSLHGDVVLDQIRSVDIGRLVKHWGSLEDIDGKQILKILRKFFDE